MLAAPIMVVQFIQMEVLPDQLQDIPYFSQQA
jgi:hypothetical protein